MTKILNITLGSIVLLMVFSFSSLTTFSQTSVKETVAKKDKKAKSLPVPADLTPRRISNTQINVTWKLTGKAKNADVVLERSFDGKDFSNAKVFRLKKGVESFSDTEDLAPGKAHFYRVRIENKKETSPYSEAFGTVLTRVNYFGKEEPPVESVVIKP